MQADPNHHKARRKFFGWNLLPHAIKATINWLVVVIESVITGIESLRQLAVRRMFWGRSSWYKMAVHLGIGGITLVVLLGGISSRLVIARVTAGSLEISLGLESVAAQGNNLQAAVSLSSLATFSIKTHIVVAGDTLENLAQTYAVNKNTIKWSNTRVLSPYNDNLPLGSQLLIPDIDGVIYEVRGGDDFNKILSTTGGDQKTVVDVNGFNEADLAMELGQLVFVPGGTLPPPPPLGRSKPAPGGYIAPTGAVSSALASFPLGFFDSPLTHPQCAGFGLNRGVNLNTRSGSYHTGVDLTKGGGCPLRAVAAGTVKFAGILDSRAAWSVIIDHGDGVESHYYHGLPGAIWVRLGDHVEKGEDIMYMGNSGNSRGTHLHLTLKYNGQLMDPQVYIPL